MFEGWRLCSVLSHGHPKQVLWLGGWTGRGRIAGRVDEAKGCGQDHCFSPLGSRGRIRAPTTGREGGLWHGRS